MIVFVFEWMIEKKILRFTTRGYGITRKILKNITRGSGHHL